MSLEVDLRVRKEGGKYGRREGRERGREREGGEGVRKEGSKYGRTFVRVCTYVSK